MAVPYTSVNAAMYLGCTLCPSWYMGSSDQISLVHHINVAAIGSANVSPSVSVAKCMAFPSSMLRAEIPTQAWYCSSLSTPDDSASRYRPAASRHAACF